MRGDRHMATVRSHNKKPKPSRTAPKKAMTPRQRALRAHAIHNRGPKPYIG